MTCAQIMKRPEFADAGEMLDWEIAHRQVIYELPITLPEAAWMDLPDAISELTHMVRMTQEVMCHLFDVMCQSTSSDPGIVAMLELASRGLTHVSEHECALLDDVEMVLRRAVSRMVQEKVANAAKGKSV